MDLWTFGQYLGTLLESIKTYTSQLPCLFRLPHQEILSRPDDGDIALSTPLSDFTYNLNHLLGHFEKRKMTGRYSNYVLITTVPDKERLVLNWKANVVLAEYIGLRYFDFLVNKLGEAVEVFQTMRFDDARP